MFRILRKENKTVLFLSLIHTNFDTEKLDFVQLLSVWSSSIITSFCSYVILFYYMRLPHNGTSCLFFSIILTVINLCVFFGIVWYISVSVIFLSKKTSHMSFSLPSQFVIIAIWICLLFVLFSQIVWHSTPHTQKTHTVFLRKHNFIYLIVFFRWPDEEINTIDVCWFGYFLLPDKNTVDAFAGSFCAFDSVFEPPAHTHFLLDKHLFEYYSSCKTTTNN